MRASCTARPAASPTRLCWAPAIGMLCAFSAGQHALCYAAARVCLLWRWQVHITTFGSLPVQDVALKNAAIQYFHIALAVQRILAQLASGMSGEEVRQCLEFVREWNTNAKTSFAAQAMLQAILHHHSPEVRAMPSCGCC